MEPFAVSARVFVKRRITGGPSLWMEVLTLTEHANAGPGAGAAPQGREPHPEAAAVEGASGAGATWSDPFSPEMEREVCERVLGDRRHGL
jgi:hypothetical protein